MIGVIFIQSMAVLLALAAGDEGVTSAESTGLRGMGESRAQVCEAALKKAELDIPAAASTFGRATVVAKKCDCAQETVGPRDDEKVWTCMGFVSWRKRD